MQLIMVNDEGRPVGILTGEPEEIIQYMRLAKENQFTDQELDTITDKLLEAISKRAKEQGG